MGSWRVFLGRLIKSKVFRRKQRPRGLRDLPLELILGIVEFLPPESAAALSLSCQYLYMILKNKYLGSLQATSRGDWYLFLKLLEKELPDYIACFYCRILHSINSSEEATRYIPAERPHGGSQYPAIHWHNERCDDFISWHFSEPVFRIAMKRHRQNRDSQAFLDLLSPKELRLFNPSIIQWHCSLARIHNNRMFMRHQTIFVPAPNLIGTELDNFAMLPTPICPHLAIRQVHGCESLGCFSVVHPYQLVVLLDIPNMGEEKVVFARCHFCLTEFQVDYKVIHGEHMAMFCTIWRDLGGGESYLDPQWKRHIESIEFVGGERTILTEIDFRLGSIRSTFEQEREFKFDSVITSTEIRDLINIAQKLCLNDCDGVRKAIGGFFAQREKEAQLLNCKNAYVGSKDPQLLYGEDSMMYYNCWWAIMQGVMPK